MTDSAGNRANDLSSLRADVTETTNVLKVTVDKLVDRGERIDAMNARAENLNASSQHFHGSARRVQRRMKWQNYRITMIIVTVIVVIITLIVLIALHPWSK